jgi:tRNA(fMet)-specific endonuclease VapC
MILDTNVLSAFADGDRNDGEVLRGQARVALPVIVLGEFRYGIAASKHRSSYEAWLESVLSHLDVLLITSATSNRTLQ